MGIASAVTTACMARCGPIPTGWGRGVVDRDLEKAVFLMVEKQQWELPKMEDVTKKCERKVGSSQKVTAACSGNAGLRERKLSMIADETRVPKAEAERAQQRG